LTSPPTTDVRCSTGAQRTIRTLRATKSEFDDDAVIGGFPHACRLGRHQSLKIDVTENNALHDLALDQSAGYLHQRLVGNTTVPSGMARMLPLNLNELRYRRT